MLSTATRDNTTPAPVLPPSDRPPDTAPNPTTADLTPEKEQVAVATNSSSMIIDSVPLFLSPQVPETMVMTEEAGHGGKKDRLQPFSYATAVARGMFSIPAPDSVRTWTPVGEHDLVSGERNGEPALTVSAEFKAKICAPWQKALVVRLLGLRIGFVNLCNRLRGLWRPKGNMEVKDLDHDCFLVKLDNEQDYYRALTDGPWVVYDHYLVVQ
ncbi:unnamed protein product [Linum trigynum]|uniref:DUF4283 domain-containing protein n=1 Tax=Linum trigynum TaxID=586398 RepID=A0AAV2FV91_9ROSI